MYLKALEIQGFKSFPEKTVIAFDRGVTAIIGPNGSGKSNVTDAVRWVLGEQSVKTLRGSKMEDVIFTGTQTRRAMSFAEVSMIIDNSSGKLPVDYDEIQITRRLFRSGESEYLLNRTVCRLRDITRLFMDTGLGRDGYSIVGQGRVDEVLSNRSEDRRRIFEEASGITRYKSRKEESERKLQSTEQNLVRVNDIIGELESRLAPLTEQAGVAQKYIELSENLKGSEIALILEQIDQFSLKNEANVENHRLVIADLAKANSRLSGLRQENEETAIQLAEVDAQTESLRADWQETNRLLGENRQAVALAGERLRHLEEQIELTAQAHQEMTASLSNINGQIADREKKSGTLSRQRSVYAAQLETSEAEMAQILDSLNQVEKEIEADKQQLDDLLEALFSDRANRGQLAGRREWLEERMLALAGEIQTGRSEIDRLKLAQEETQKQLYDSNAQANALKIERESLKKDLAAHQEQLALINTDLEKDRQNERNLAYRLRTLTNLENSFEGYQQAVRAVLTKSREEQLAESVLGTVGSLMATPKKYERAIETALGPALQNIVTADQETASSLIQFLKETRSGRATFLPLTNIRSRTLDDRIWDLIKDEPGLVDIASNLVNCAPKISDIAGHLLGRVVITEDLKSALAISARTGQRLRLVSLEGDVVNPGGSLTGGYHRRETSGLLGRKQTLAALEEQITQIGESIREKEQTAAKLDGTYQRLIRQEAELSAKKQLQSEQQMRLESSLSSIEQSQTFAGQKLTALNDEQQKLQVEQQSVQEAKADLALAIAKRESEIERLRTAIIEREEASHSESAKRDDLRQQITEWTISLQSIEESLNEANELLERLQSDLSGRREQISRHSQQQIEWQDQIAGLIAKRQQCATTEDELTVELSKITALIDQSVRQKDQIEDQRRGYLAKYEAAADQIAQLQGEVARIEAQKSRLDNQIDDAKNRLWELYELTVAQADQWRQPQIKTYETTRQVNKLKEQIRALEPVNLNAITELAALKERCEFLTGQRDDIEAAQEQLKKVIRDLTKEMKTHFLTNFQKINAYFAEVFAELFGGGTAEVNLEDEDDVLNCGIEIKAQPPGKKLQNLLLLSGGERCLTAIALLFAILKLRPTPFCVLDEVESTLDDANVLRFIEYIRRYADQSQFILVTHRKGTMEAADRIYGVTMPERGISRVLSLELDQEQAGKETT